VKQFVSGNFEITYFSLFDGHFCGNVLGGFAQVYNIKPQSQLF
jgi:hypothetical protein